MEIMADKSETPAAGQRMLQMLRRLMDLAVLLEIRPDNPTLGVKMPKSKNPEGFHTWSEEEIDIFNKAYPPGTTAHTAMTLMLWTGAAVGDACQMGWHNVKDGKIEYRRRKTRNSVDILIVIPIQPPLQAVLDLIPKEQKTFLLNNRGVQYPAATLGQGMARWCDAAGLTHCTSHGLRKACARRLADALASAHEIQAVTGHTNLAMVSHYTRAADRTSLASSGMAKVLAQSERGIEGG